ncbi:GGDEF domain-containing protein [Devosia enhydra]|nr:GGDEF domain-containing protein [Devosia enhydra]
MTFFAAWLSSRAERFMLTWSLGLLLVVGNILAFSSYNQVYNPFVGALAFALLVFGLAVIFGAAREFRLRRPRGQMILSIGIPGAVFVALPFALGLDGLGVIIGNLLAALLLGATAIEYWAGRKEAPLPIFAVVLLYAVCALSFLPCAALVILAGNLSIGAAPSNWAEDLNLTICIITLTGIGALSLSLNQSRLTQRHRHEAETDVLTGLLNRRAMFDRYGSSMLPANVAMILFDLDDFKSINDRFGHAVGDAVLRKFTAALRSAAGPDDLAVRMGGEEFALLVLEASTEGALKSAEAVRLAFEAEAMLTDAGLLQTTVSAGLCFSDAPIALEESLRRADSALYRAKRDGRNRVVACNLRLVA